ncbi:hypothetical protein LOK49_LG12G00356, partial [Camellia lanceoleosa]
MMMIGFMGLGESALDQILWRGSFFVVIPMEENAGSLHRMLMMISRAYNRLLVPKNVRWTDDGLERDLYIQTSTVTVLAMDGRRRWLDIKKLVGPHCSYKASVVILTSRSPKVFAFVLLQ